MEKGRLIFVDEKECRQVCSTVILAHCKDEQTRAKCPTLTIGESIIQKKEIKKDVPLSSASKTLEYLEVMTPAELAINVRSLMLGALGGKEKASEIYSVDSLVFGGLDLFPDGIIFLNEGRLNIENLRFDVDRVEVRILRYLEVSERFDVQSQIYGKNIELPLVDESGINFKSEEPTEISPFVYIYLPHLFAKKLRETYRHDDYILVDVIGMMRLTGGYIPLKSDGRSITKTEGIIDHIYTITGSDRLARFEGERKEKIKKYLEKTKEIQKNADKKTDVYPSLMYHKIEYLFKMISSKPYFNFGIQPIAIWRILKVD